MHIPLRQLAIEHVCQTIERVRPLVVVVARRDRDLASQIRRALSSVALNVAEGFGSEAGNARLRFESARGSLYETEAGVRVAVAS
jgi:four helix bundle protein